MYPVFLLSSCRRSVLQSLTGLSASCPVCPSLTLCIKMSPTPHLSSTHVTSGSTSCRGTSLQTVHIITESTVSTVMIALQRHGYTQSAVQTYRSVLFPRLYSIHNLTFRNILHRCLKCFATVWCWKVSVLKLIKKTMKMNSGKKSVVVMWCWIAEKRLSYFCFQTWAASDCFFVCRFLGNDNKETFFKTTQRHQVVSSQSSK